MADVTEFADELAELLIQQAALGEQVKALLEAAKEAGVAPGPLRKVAGELAMTSDKLAKKLEAEEQLELLRRDVQLVKRKGLDGADRASSRRMPFAGASAGA